MAATAEPNYYFDQYDDGTRWWWLRHNRFFDITTLTGYSFINRAKTVFEVIFWYILLITFGVFTTMNVLSTVQYYAGRPTHTSVIVESETKRMESDHFKLKVNISLFEYHTDSPIKVHRPLQDVPCYNVLEDEMDIHMRGIITRNKEFFQESNLEALSAELLDKVAASIAEEKQLKRVIWSDWYSHMQDEYSSKLGGLLSRHTQNLQDNKPLLGTKDANEMEQIILDLSAFLGPWDPKVLSFALMMLESLESGTRITNNLNPVSKMLSSKSLSVRDLTESLFSAVIRLLGVETPDVPDTKIILKGWTRDLWTMTQEFTFQFYVPPKTRRITLNIHAIQLTRFMLVVNELHEHLRHMRVLELTEQCGEPCTTELFDCAVLVECRELNSNKTTLFQSMHTNMLSEFIKYYSMGTYLMLEFPTGHVPLEPLKNYIVEMQPTGQFISHTSDCYVGTLENCVGECLHDLYMEACGCYQWSLDHFSSEKGDPLCNYACKAVHGKEEECRTDCGRQMAHPCNMSLFRFEETHRALEHSVFELMDGSDDLLELHPELPLFAINMILPDTFSHPQFTEKYQMTFGNFMAELGGVMEFWLGVNLIALIHLVLYLLRQVRHLFNKKTKPGRTIRRILTWNYERKPVELPKEKEEEEPTEEKKEELALIAIINGQHEWIERQIKLIVERATNQDKLKTEIEARKHAGNKVAPEEEKKKDFSKT